MKPKIYLLVLFVMLVCLAHNISYATIINVPADSSTIQSALNIATSGDTVLVASGTYNENLQWPNINGIKLLSVDDADNTIIDGTNSGRVITFDVADTIDTNTIIDGVTIQNGETTSYDGGGIYLYGNESPTISNNTITNNSAESGGGISCYDNSSPIISNNTISSNSAYYYCGGGICCDYNSSSIIINNVIINNLANNTAYGSGGGIAFNYSSPIISNNIITNNSGYWNGGGITCGSSSPIITNNTITNNSAESCGGIHISDSPIIGGHPDSTNNIYHNYSADGNNCCTYDSTIANYNYWGNFTDTEINNTIDNLSFTYRSYEPYEVKWYADAIDDMLYFAELTLSIDALTGEDTIRVSTYIDTFPDFGVGLTDSLDKFWNITIDGGISNIDARLSFYFDNSEIDSFMTKSSKAITIYHWNGSAWDSLYTTHNSNNQVFCDVSGVSNIEGIWTLKYERIRSHILYVPSEYPTIQTALNCAANGDTVLVAAGTYNENIIWPNRNGIKLISESNAIIDGSNIGRVINFNVSTPIDTTTVIDGFIIQNGSDMWGGGIYLYDNASPTISNNVIMDNWSMWGSGIYCDSSSPTISNNNIYNNSAIVNGGGIYCYSSSPTISNNNIYYNSADYGDNCYKDSGSPNIDYNYWGNFTIEEINSTLYGVSFTYRSYEPYEVKRYANTIGNTLYFAEFELIPNSISASDTIRISTYIDTLIAGASSATGNFVNKFWEISLDDSITHLEATMIFYYDDSEISNINENEIKELVHYDGTNWHYYDGDLDAPNNCVSYTQSAVDTLWEGKWFLYSVNTSPVINFDNISQDTDGENWVAIDYIGSDAENDTCDLVVFEYSEIGNKTWQTMTFKDGVGSDSTTNIQFLASGTNLMFAWDVGTDLIDTEDDSVYIRLGASDGGAMLVVTGSIPFPIDTKAPQISDITYFLNHPLAGDSTITLQANFIEHNPSDNYFYYALNGTIYADSIAGTSGTITPIANLPVGILDGNDYFTKVKCLFYDTFGHFVISESDTNIYVTPYTPEPPTVEAFLADSSLHISINKHPAEVSNLLYCIYCSAPNTDIDYFEKYIDENGDPTPIPVWRSIANWGTLVVSGLTQSLTSYHINTQSRNYNDLATSVSDTSLAGMVAVDVNELNKAPIITEYALNQNYPNPFNPETIIRYDLPQTSYVNLSIYNIKGQLVKILDEGMREMGQYNIIWNGKDYNNKEVSSGIYIYKIQAGDFTKTNRMILLK